MRDDIAIVLRTCADCGFPISARVDAPCPYCAALPDARDELQALYGLPITSLQRRRLALRDAPESHLRTVLDVLVALYVISEEPATPAQLAEVIAKVTARPAGASCRYQGEARASATPAVATRSATAGKHASRLATALASCRTTADTTCSAHSVRCSRSCPRPD